MGKGVRYTPEFREKAVRLLAESRDSHSSETRALAQVAGNLGVAPETLRRWRNQADGAAAAQSVTTRPAKGTGGRPDLVERRFRACAPNRLHVADITYARMADGRFAYTAFVTDVYARRIVGWACATGMGTREPPLQALEQAISRASKHGGTQGLVRHGDHGARYIGTVYTTRVPEYGTLPSTGTVGDSYDNAMAESVNGAYKTELVWRSKPFRTLGELELATFQWVSWWNTKRLHASLDHKTPQQVENEYYEHQTAQAASL